MKRIISLLLVLLLLTGCGAPAQSVPEEPQETMTEEEPAAEAPLEEDPAAEEPVEEEIPEEPTEEEASSENAPIPLGTFSAETLTGETVTEAIFAEADLTVINVWATYCDPCKQQMPTLGLLDRELEGVQVLGIASDVIDQTGAPDPDQIEFAIELAEIAGCDYPILVLNLSLAYLGFANLGAVPATLFVDSEGNLVGQGFYGALDEATWRLVIAERLEAVQS